MAIPFRARVDERRFLNLPGFDGGAYVVAYVENTTERDVGPYPSCDDDCDDCPHNFEPKTILEISDGYGRVNLGFDVDSEEARANSLYKLDTLIAALRVLRSGIVDESAEYDRRERELEELRGE